MIYRFVADVVLVLHLGFIAFVVAGGFLVPWRRAIVWLHVPAVTWAVLIEFMDWRCPLTPLEIWARQRAGETGYSGGFVEHYLLPIVYPDSLTREVQIALGAGVLLANALVYAWIVFRRRSEAGR